MNLSRNFTLQELIKSDTAIRLNIHNEPNGDQIDKLKQHTDEITKLKKDIEKLKDATRDIKFANGNGGH